MNAPFVAIGILVLFWLGGGMLLLTSSYLWAQEGGESIPMLALLAGAAEIGLARPICAGVLAGAAVWFRPEAAIGAGFLCVQRRLSS